MTEIGTKCVLRMVTEKRAVHIASVKSDSIYRFCHADWQPLSSEPLKQTENASGDATPSFGVCKHFEFQFVRIQNTTFCSSMKQLTEFVSSAQAFKFRLKIRIRKHIGNSATIFGCWPNRRHVTHVHIILYAMQNTVWPRTANGSSSNTHSIPNLHSIRAQIYTKRVHLFKIYKINAANIKRDVSRVLLLHACTLYNVWRTCDSKNVRSFDIYIFFHLKKCKNTSTVPKMLKMANMNLWSHICISLFLLSSHFRDMYKEYV